MKFKIGEIAVVTKNSYNLACRLRLGDEVAVVRVGPFAIGTSSSHGPGETSQAADYEVTADDIAYWFCDECDLRKRRSPEVPAEDEFQEQLKHWLELKKMYLA